ncbi:MAG: anti-sigma factor antagonist [Marmoricola sp.]|nr:anti-sigma factor antagonist [Marmoricola sp.]
MPTFAQPHLTQSSIGDVTIVGPVGEFDIGTIDLLRSTFAAAITPHQNKLVIDLTGTRFLDSMALGTIIGAGRRASGWGGWVRLVAPPTNIRNVLRLTEIDTVFGLYDSVEQAVAHNSESGARPGGQPAPA